MANELWVTPRTHRPQIAGLSAVEIDQLALILRDVLRTQREVSPDHNWLFQQYATERAAHWYVVLVPRTSPVAGFELSTGTFVDTGSR